jgi:hypothetical protein
MDAWAMTLMRNMIVMMLKSLAGLDLETRRENVVRVLIDIEYNTTRLQRLRVLYSV